MNLRKESKTLSEIFLRFRKVAYVPLHAYDDIKHPDVEIGFVSSTSDKFVFVRFSKQLAKFGWNGTTSQSCDPDTLHLLDGYWPQETF
jgi:hypothetical protein